MLKTKFASAEKNCFNIFVYTIAKYTMCGRIPTNTEFTNLSIRKMTMTSFAITLCDQCCQRHLVGQRVVSDISVVRSC